MDGFAVLNLLKSDVRTRGIPVLVNSNKRVTDAERARLGEVAAILPKDGDSSAAQLAALRSALAQAGLKRAGAGADVKQEVP